MPPTAKRSHLLSPAQVNQVRLWLRRVRRPAWLGNLRRTTPLSQYYGYDRGTPTDRYYIEKFLEHNRGLIRGRVLEVHDRAYTERFGSSVEQSDILDIDPSNPQATIIADLTAANNIPEDTFDCFILTQTLHLIYDTKAAVFQAHRLLRPGGVLLVTVPAVSRIIYSYGPDRDFWRFTAAACTRLFGDIFGSNQVEVQAYGNVLTCVAFLMGMAVEDLSRRELDVYDEHYPLIVTIRATKL